MPAEQHQESLPGEEQSQSLLDGGNPPTDPSNSNPLVEFIGPNDEYYWNYHPNHTRHPCNSSGNFLPAANINELLTLWNMSLLSTGGLPIFRDSSEMYKMINSMPLGEVQWEKISTSYTGEWPAENVPPWMNDMYDTWFWDPKEVIHNVLSQPDFSDAIDYRPFQEYASATDS
ncbi:hypothetical protein EDC04DRAFT_2601667 [Pisolithus marmoratus]|nr:hypothetical protein EDC04DRAFT_2601667 [Pisolithus marmoratus]